MPIGVNCAGWAWRSDGSWRQPYVVPGSQSGCSPCDRDTQGARLATQPICVRDELGRWGRYSGSTGSQIWLENKPNLKEPSLPDPTRPQKWRSKWWSEHGPAGGRRRLCTVSVQVNAPKALANWKPLHGLRRTGMG